MKIKKNVLYYLSLLLLGVLFFFCLGEKSPIILSDSMTYLNPESNIPAGYIIYPAFVRYITMVFGERNGLQMIVLIQSLLALSVAVYLTNVIRRIFDLSYIQGIVVFGLSLLQYGYTLPEHVLTREIMTEALAVPIFNLVMVLMVRFFNYQKKRDSIISLILGIILIFIRPQLLTIFAALLVVVLLWILWQWYTRLDKKKKLYFNSCVVILLCAFIFMIKSVMVQGINVFSQLSQAITGKVICIIEPEDRELFVDTEQGMFDYIYEHIDKNQHLVSYFSEGVKRGDDIMEAINENSKDFLELTRVYYQENYQQYYAEDFFITAPEMRNNIISTLFENRFGDVITLTLQLLPSSFVSAIFIQPDSIKGMCYVMAFMLYLASFGVIIYAKKRKVDSKYFSPVVITYIMLVTNVLLTNFIFYGQQRYVTYTFGWFYISVFVLLCGLQSKRDNA